jgi:hypothetical protein
MALDLLQNDKIGLKNKEISKWSNGSKHDQDQFAEFPYIIVGAVICKNICIKGFKNNESVNNTLLEM